MPFKLGQRHNSQIVSVRPACNEIKWLQNIPAMEAVTG